MARLMTQVARQLACDGIVTPQLAGGRMTVRGMSLFSLMCVGFGLALEGWK